MRVRWTNEALISLKSETKYISENDLQASLKVVSCVYKTVGVLSDDPYMGRKCVYETRELINPKHPFVVWYRVKENIVEILLVLHTARKFNNEHKMVLKRGQIYFKLTAH